MHNITAGRGHVITFMFSHVIRVRDFKESHDGKLRVTWRKQCQDVADVTLTLLTYGALPNPSSPSLLVLQGFHFIELIYPITFPKAF